MPQQFKDEVLYDIRLLDRHVQRGLLTRDDIAKRREASPDLTDQCEKLDVDQMGRGAQGKRSQN
jgi:hypothetical protein